MGTHSSILTWRTLWTEKPAELQSMGSQRVRHNCGKHLIFSSACSVLSRVQLCATPRTVARQAPLSMGFSR